jgi:hypothetical protein
MIKAIYLGQDIYRNTEGMTVKLLSTAYDSLGRDWLYLKLSNRVRPVRVQVFKGYTFPKTKKWHITLEQIYDDGIRIEAVKS